MSSASQRRVVPYATRRSLRTVAVACAVVGLVACSDDGSSSTQSAVPPSVVAIAHARITVQPVSSSNLAGSTTAFSVVATGDDLAFQWQRSTDAGASWTSIAGASASIYSIGSADVSLDGTQYRVIVSNTIGSVISSAATLTVYTAVIAPRIVMQSTGRAVRVGGSTDFYVTATGTTLTYQWQTSTDDITWTTLPDETHETIDVSHVALSDSGRRFRAIVANAAGSVTSADARLDVLPLPTLAVFVEAPAATSVVAPAPATFDVRISSDSGPQYEWQASSDGGATFVDAGFTFPGHEALTTPPTTIADDGKLYRVIVINDAGSIISPAVRLTVTPTPVAPVITSQPTSQTVTLSSAATFSVEGTGSPSPVYQWQVSVDGGTTFTNVNGAVARTFVTPATTIADHGKRFRVLLTNSAGTVTSNAALLTVQ